jgi:glycosyltransferase involved in cell wall biosynthesis
MKKVLLLAYHYPPNPEVGGLRPAKFVRYLPEYGWEPTVLTTLTSDVSASMIGSGTAEVHRVQEWPHPLKSYERLKRRWARRKGLEEELIAKTTVSYAVAMSHSRTRGIAWLKRWLMAFFWLPDQEVGWLAPAIWRGVRIVRKKRISHVITTGPPHTCHLIGLALKLITGVRWVADFRDPWSLNDKFPIFRNQATDWIESSLIRSVMEKADLLLSVTPQMTDRVRKEHTDLDPSKAVTLTSGFDPADFIGLLKARPSVTSTIFSYVGTFYHGRTPEPFLRALRSLIADGALKQSDVLVKFVGDVARAEGRSVQEIVRQLGLGGNVRIASTVPRHEALALIVESDVVLVLDEKHPAQIPFKLYEAMAAGAVIFNVGSRGAVSEVLAKTGRGISVDHTNSAEIRAGILECIRRSRAVRAQRAQQPWCDHAIQEFNFLNLTGRLAMLLNGMGESHQGQA